jgi:hypothetical protein
MIRLPIMKPLWMDQRPVTGVRPSDLPEVPTVSSGPEFSRGDHQRSFRDESGPSDESDEPAKGRRSSALDQVLQETLELLSREKITPDELEALRAVARRYKDRPLEAHPITRELVSAILDKKFRTGWPTDQDRQEMVGELADYLHETPTTRQKLEHFWRQLRESVQ